MYFYFKFHFYDEIDRISNQVRFYVKSIPKCRIWGFLILTSTVVERLYYLVNYILSVLYRQQTKYASINDTKTVSLFLYLNYRGVFRTTF